MCSSVIAGIDSAPASRLLSADLRAIFGLGSVFIDTNDIRIGADWPARIDERLQAASIVLVVIGPTWLRVADGFGRRRLDKLDDWVRNEIAYAIDNKLVIIPFLIAGASSPDKKALPKRIIKLANHQAIKVDYESWDNDLNPRHHWSSMSWVSNGQDLPPLCGYHDPKSTWTHSQNSKSRMLCDAFQDGRSPPPSFRGKSQTNEQN